MWEPPLLTNLWASTACYRDSFTFLLWCINRWPNVKRANVGRWPSLVNIKLLFGRVTLLFHSFLKIWDEQSRNKETTLTEDIVMSYSQCHNYQRYFFFPQVILSRPQGRITWICPVAIGLRIWQALWPRRDSNCRPQRLGPKPFTLHTVQPLEFVLPSTCFN
jgi:hypothetical protein